MRKGKLSQFIGRQLSRIKAGQTYYLIAMSTITAISTFSFALQINLWLLISIFFPIGIIFILFVGYLMDKSDVVSMDMMKTVEMTHRYVNTADLKLFEFQIVLTKGIIKSMESIQNKEPVNFKEFDNDYNKYLKKWNPNKKNE